MDDAHGRVAVNPGPTAISERLSAARAALLGLDALEASPDHARASSAMRDRLAAGVVPSNGGTLMGSRRHGRGGGHDAQPTPGAGTTTLESTTSVLAVGRVGLARVEATPLPRGEWSPAGGVTRNPNPRGSCVAGLDHRDPPI
jgi:hypothetical protein